MFSLITRALWIPLRDIIDVLKIFWPLVLLFIGFNIAGQYYLENFFTKISTSPRGGDGSTNLSSMFMAYFFIMFIAIVYMYLLALDGIVKWHRKLVLDMPARAISLWPKYRSWNYFGYTLLLSIFLFLIAIIPFGFFFQFMFPPIDKIQQGVDTTRPDSILAFREKFIFQSLQASIVLNTVICFFASFFLKYLVLELPKVSVEEKGFQLDKNALRNIIKGSGWQAALFIMTWLHYTLVVVFFLFLLSTDLISIKELGRVTHEQNPWIITYNFLATFVAIYGPIAFATLLSLFYRERVRAALS